jgi:ABC-type glycerol-3-phosphate transport system substrate-binding protein
MRTLSIAMIGLALLAACASSSPQQRTAAPAASAPQSGAMASPSTTAQGDAIDRFAAAYEAQRGRRY